MNQNYQIIRVNALEILKELALDSTTMTLRNSTLTIWHAFLKSNLEKIDFCPFQKKIQYFAILLKLIRKMSFFENSIFLKSS